MSRGLLGCEVSTWPGVGSLSHHARWGSLSIITCLGGLLTVPGTQDRGDSPLGKFAKSLAWGLALRSSGQVEAHRLTPVSQVGPPLGMQPGVGWARGQLGV